jgi:hypothetical protein
MFRSCKSFYFDDGVLIGRIRVDEVIPAPTTPI